METPEVLFSKPYECVNPLKPGLSNNEFSLTPIHSPIHLTVLKKKAKLMNTVLPTRPTEIHTGETLML